jgi:peptidoglycan/xylan/chitin deacetylase (PgdA/CDA1 family)
VKAILTYHSIDPSGSPVSVDDATFRRHVRWLASGAVRVVTLGELLRLPDATAAVALTFDDGFENVGTIAAPLLLEQALPAAVFVVSDHAGRTNAWGGRADPGIPTLPLLGWDALARLADAGLELGAHSRTHPHLTALRGDALNDEIVGSAERIRAETGRAVRSFAYPYGSVDREVAAAAAGFDHACTTEMRAVRGGDDPRLLPRLDAYYFRAPGLLESWDSARFRRYLWLRSQARRVRRRFALDRISQ